jgi:hypothetical protein
MRGAMPPLLARACTAWGLVSAGAKKKYPPFVKSQNQFLFAFQVKTYPYYEPA